MVIESRSAGVLGTTEVHISLLVLGFVSYFIFYSLDLT